MKLDQTNNRISLPKLGWIRYRNSREVIGEVKNVTVIQSCGKWYVSIQTEYEVPEQVHKAASMVGLDAGVTKLATLSDGTVYQPVNSFKASQRKLAMLQRQLSRKVKFSASWQKQKKKIQRLHSHIANIRRDYLHKVTSEISKNHAMIVIEDLKVSNMSKSAKGTAERPGRNIRAKSGLNRSILDQGGTKCADSLSTSSSGVVVRYWRYLRHTQASVVPAVVIRRKKTVKRKVNSCVRYAAIPRTPISTEHVTF